MGLFKRLFGKKETEKIFTQEELLEAGVCPNCWGHQEYEGQYRQFVVDQTQSNINKDHQHQKAFIQQFVETNVTGIHLKRNEGHLSCPACRKKY